MLNRSKTYRDVIKLIQEIEKQSLQILIECCLYETTPKSAHSRRLAPPPTLAQFVLTSMVTKHLCGIRMDNSIYVTLSRELSLFRDMDVAANNVANANTTGFNAEHIMFNTFVQKDINQGQPNKVNFAYNASTYRNTENGPIRTTGNDLDVAIQGNGYFTVDTPLGDRYTRAGNFQIDGAGTLVNADGYAVMDSSGQHINFPENVTSVQIGEAGNIKVNGEDFGAIGVVQFDNPQLMERLSGTMFKSEIAPQQAENFRIAQGSLESANVQPVTELTHMITLTHTVADTAKFIELVYDLERKTSNTWAQQA